MQPFDVDGVQVVSDLRDICWDRPRGAGLVTQHLGHEVVWTAKTNVWAVVLICVRDWKRGGWQEPRFVLTRWRKERGAWRLFAHFRLPRVVLEGVSTQWSDLWSRCVETATAQSSSDGRTTKAKTSTEG